MNLWLALDSFFTSRFSLSVDILYLGSNPRESLSLEKKSNKLSRKELEIVCESSRESFFSSWACQTGYLFLTNNFLQSFIYTGDLVRREWDKIFWVNIILFSSYTGTLLFVLIEAKRDFYLT